MSITLSNAARSAALYASATTGILGIVDAGTATILTTTRGLAEVTRQ